jgi:ssDNA-binding Zn-finger/Zn-ribbon topoisomerase 1
MACGASAIRTRGRETASYLADLMRLMPEEERGHVAVVDSGHLSKRGFLGMRCSACGGQAWVSQGEYNAVLLCTNPACGYAKRLSKANATELLRLAGITCPSCKALPLVRSGPFGLFVRCSRSNCDWKADLGQFV